MLSGLSQRARALLLGVVGSVAAFFVFGGARGGGGSRGSSDPFDAVPRDSFIVATVNAAELRRSAIYDLLFGRAPSARGPDPSGHASTQDGDGRSAAVLSARALGMGSLADACGFDPLSRVERLALAVPEHGEKGELGVAAHVTVSRDELSRCTSALASARGGKIEKKDVGSFVVVEEAATAGAPRGRLGYGRGGLLVASRGAWFDAMLAAADGRAPSAKDAAPSAMASADHAALRASLTAREGWRSPTVLVTMVIPSSLRDRIKSDMASELSGAAGGAPEHGAEGAMSGVLGVSSLGLALRAGGAGQTIDLAAELACESEEACAAVEELLLRERLRWSKELALRMIGLGPLLDSIEVKRDGPRGAPSGPRVRVTAGAPADALAEAIGRVLRLKARREP